MKHRFELIITASALFCLSLAAVAPADSCVKQLYVDGNFIDDANADQGLTWNYNRLTIGAESNRWYLYNEYVGDLAEFAVYAGVMDPCSILAHYEAQDSNAAYVAAVGANNPLLWLRFAEATPDHNDAAENSGWIGIDANYVTVDGNAMTRVVGINANAYALRIPEAVSSPDGSGHCVDVWDDNGDFGEDWEGDVTVEVWVKFTDINSMPSNDFPRFFQHNGDWTETGSYGVVVQDPNQLGIIGGGQVATMGLPYDINDGQWHHIVVTYASTYEEPNLPPGGTYTEEVAADNPVLWIRFEDEDPCDSSGNGNWVAYGPATKIVSGVEGIGSSILLDTKSGYVAAATNGPNQPPYIDYNDNYAFAPNDITFEFWFRSIALTTTHDSGRLFQQHRGWQNEPNGPGMKLNGTTQICTYCGQGTSYKSAAVIDGEWHQIVVTYDEDHNGVPNTIQALNYIDGKLKHTIDYTGARAHLGVELSHVVIGAAGDWGGGNYNILPGYFDEFAVYEGILDPNRVEAHYNAWFPSNCAELKDKGGEALPAFDAADRNDDCHIDFYDFAFFGQEWALCNDPNSSDPNCVPNW